MAILVGSGKRLTTDDGIPYMWQSGDVATTPNEVGIITASDGAANDNFGRSVAVGSGRIVVGAWYDDVNSNTDQGSSYIYDLDGTNEIKITASDGAASDNFGHSVAVGSGRIVIGAYNDDDNGLTSGSAYIYNLDGTGEVKITASDGAAGDYFGWSVAVGSGRIVVGAWGDGSGSAYIYDLDGNNEVKITASDGAAGDNFGYSVAVGSGKIVVGATGDDDNGTGSGSAYIYDLDGTNEVKITVSDGATFDSFGSSVAVGSGRIVVGAYGDDVNSNNDQGTAYIFDLDGNQLSKITASDGAASDRFGWSVAVGSGRIVIAAHFDDDNGVSSGSAYIYDLDGNHLSKITASDGALSDYFGWSVAVGSGRIVVGASGDDDNGSSSGSTYIFDTPLVYTLYDAIELNY